MPVDEVLVDAGVTAVPAARRFVRGTLRRWGVDGVVDSAELAASELVTNALLYAGPPVRLGVSYDGDAVVRLEVHDSSAIPPVRPRLDVEGMTGRGLALVEALTSRWGVERAGAGKVVWAELTPGAEAAEPSDIDTDIGDTDIDALLAAFDDELDRGSQRYRVTLGDVDTDLLLAAKAHVDSLAREFTLAAAGAAAGLTTAVPEHLARLVEAVVNEFADARQAIKRQALDAAARGEARTTLVLTLPVEAADAGERYLAALEQADGYARAARLLTLEAPPRHRAFRRWYVTSLVAALRAVAAGEPATPAPTFEAFLLTEIDRLAAVQRSSERAARLHRVTGALATPTTAEEVGSAVLAAAAEELGAGCGAVVISDDDGPRVAAHVGCGGQEADGAPPPVVERFEAIGDVLRTGDAVWVESREDRDRRYPALAAVAADVVSTCAVPLAVGDRLIGTLWLGFPEPRLFDDDERSFLSALAAVAAQTIDRARLHQVQAITADRLRRLQTVTSALATTRDVDGVAGVMMAHAADALEADVGTLALLEPDGHTLRITRTHQVAAPHAQQWQRFDVVAQLPSAEAVRTGELVAAASIAERDSRWPLLAGLPPYDEHALVCLPLMVEGRALGAVSLSFRGVRSIDDRERTFLTALAQACAQALDRAITLQQLTAANERLEFLARASEELSSSLDYGATLSRVAQLVVPRLADWCVVHVVDGEQLVPLAVAHVDPAKVELARQVQRRWPDRVGDPGGVATVVRTGQPLVVPVVTPELIEAAPYRDPAYTAVLHQLGFSSVIIAPLTARDRTLGALTLIRAESGRHYGDTDLAFAVELARRAAVAIDDADLFRRLAGGPPDPHPEAGSVPRH